MTPEARIVAEVPLVSGRGRHVVAIDEAGALLLFLVTQDGEERDEHVPRARCTGAEAVALAEAVLAGEQRIVTDPGVLHVLAAAVLVAAREPAPAVPEWGDPVAFAHPQELARVARGLTAIMDPRPGRDAVPLFAPPGTGGTAGPAPVEPGPGPTLPDAPAEAVPELEPEAL